MRGTIALTSCLAVALMGCVSMRPSEKAQLRELEAYGIPEEEQAIKDPGLAASLSVLPGGGNFYLAVGSGESSQWVIGVLNLLVWPFSVMWGVPVAVIDARTINKKETVYYYTLTPTGRQEFERIKADFQKAVSIPVPTVAPAPPGS